ncbi:MAG: DUF4390 domain-containing protein [Hydrogenophilus sp.]|nr:DUF4390 domain-containing protein [Hydrogenophilus sp.]
MGSSMRCSAKVGEQRRRGLRALLWVIGPLGWTSLARVAVSDIPEEMATIRAARLRREGEFWVLDAEVEWGLPPAAWQALLEYGVALPLRFDLRLWQTRSWWPDTLVWAMVWRFELSFRPTTGNWRLRHNEGTIASGNYWECMALLATIRGWKTFTSDRVQPDPAVVAELEVGVDEGQLAPALRLQARERPQLIWQAAPYRWRPWR